MNSSFNQSILLPSYSYHRTISIGMLLTKVLIIIQLFELVIQNRYSLQSLFLFNQLFFQTAGSESDTYSKTYSKKNSANLKYNWETFPPLNMLCEIK